MCTQLASERSDNTPTSGTLHFAPSQASKIIQVPIVEPGPFERAGGTDDEGRRNVRDSISDVLREIEQELKVRSLNWIGGIYDNTRTPHGHLAVSRWALDEKTGKTW